MKNAEFVKYLQCNDANFLTGDKGLTQNAGALNKDEKDQQVPVIPGISKDTFLGSKRLTPRPVIVHLPALGFSHEE